MAEITFYPSIVSHNAIRPYIGGSKSAGKHTPQYNDEEIIDGNIVDDVSESSQSINDTVKISLYTQPSETDDIFIDITKSLPPPTSSPFLSYRRTGEVVVSSFANAGTVLDIYV